MGEANYHALLEHILRYGIAAHLAGQSQFQVFSNMNLYHLPRFPRRFITPDVMVQENKSARFGDPARDAQLQRAILVINDKLAHEESGAPSS